MNEFKIEKKTKQNAMAFQSFREIKREFVIHSSKSIENYSFFETERNRKTVPLENSRNQKVRGLLVSEESAMEKDTRQCIWRVWRARARIGQDSIRGIIYTFLLIQPLVTKNWRYNYVCDGLIFASCGA